MPLNKSTNANKRNFACVPCVLRDQKSFHSKKFVNSVYYFLTSIQVRFLYSFYLYLILNSTAAVRVFYIFVRGFAKMFSNLSYTYYLNKRSVSRKSRNYPRIVYIWVNQSKFVYMIITVYDNIIVQNFVEQLMR